jgi:SAM-dependent methyltransferase
MDRVIYDHMVELDQLHWWYRGRREVLAALIERSTQLPKRAKILEIGCGTGHNLAMLGAFGRVDAVEFDDQAREIAERRLGRSVKTGMLPELAGVPDRTYHLIAAFDVIEHVDDDSGAIAAIATKLKPGGKLILTVPAQPWMWSEHDILNHHKRRYSKRSLRRLIDDSPLQLEKIGYFNSLLFPLAVAQRLARRDVGIGLPAAPLNTAFRHIFAVERHFVDRIPLPFGLSLFAVASAAPRRP